MENMRINDLDAAEISFNVLFEQISPDGKERRIIAEPGTCRDFLEMLRIYLKKERLEREMPDKPLISSEPDTVDALNALALLCKEREFSTVLDEITFKALMRLNAATPLRPALLKSVEQPNTLTGNTLRHAINFIHALDRVLQTSFPLQVFASKKKDPDFLGRLIPSAGKISVKYSIFQHSTLKGLAMELALQYEKNDPFAHSRAFRYAHNVFIPVELNTIRAPKDFYGYSEAKQLFLDHFTAFDEGRHNLPLLISGLPGLGKTQMSIAYALSFPDITLILPGPESLQEGLEGLVAQLTASTAHKFVVFFDDIDTRNLNWYYFRTHVGGSFSLPHNVMTVIASNYKFPPNITSRGRSFTFPFFDEIRCQEMIEDMLLSHKMKNVPPELLAVIAADYVESYGQKLFDELSPRTLSRYLELYMADREKRRRMLDFSRGEIITKPDPQAFYAQNMKLLRALYGKEAIDEIREKELSAVQ